MYQTGEGFVPDLIRHDSAVALVAQNPGADEEQGRRVIEYVDGKPRYESCDHQPLTGATGYAVNTKWLPKAGLSRDDVSLLNILKCRLIVNGKRTNHMPQGAMLKQAVAHCTEAHFKLPEKATTLVAMGMYAFAHLGGAGLRKPDGKPAGVYDYRGYLLPLTTMQKAQVSPLTAAFTSFIPRRVYCVVHPADLFRDRDMLLPSRLDWMRLGKLLKGAWPKPLPPTCVLDHPEQVEVLFDKLDNAPWVVVDTEYIKESKLLTLIGIGAWDHLTKTVYGGQLVWLHSEAETGTRREFIRRYAQLIKRRPIWFWNAKADVRVLHKNINVGGPRGQDYRSMDDAMILHHILWSDQAHDLEYTASTLGEYEKLKHLSRTDPILYNWGDVVETVEIIVKLKQQLLLDTRLEAVYERKRRLLPLIIEREAVGLRVNQAFVERAIPQYQARLAAAETFAEAYCGYPINLMSSGKRGQVVRYMNEVEGFSLESIDKDSISEERRAFKPFDAEYEKQSFTEDYLLGRIDEGAHPLLELRAWKAQLTQTMSHYLQPLVVS